MSTAINETEKLVRDVVRRECRLGDPVAKREIVARLEGVVGSASIGRALTRLVERGLISRPSEGNYFLEGSTDA